MYTSFLTLSLSACYYGWHGGATQPQLAWAQLVGESYHVVRVVSLPLWEDRVRTVVRPDGSKAEQTYKVSRLVHSHATMTWPRAAAAIEGLDGRPVEEQRAAGLLKDPALVLLVSPGAQVDPRYRSALKPDTLVLMRLPPPVEGERPAPAAPDAFVALLKAAKGPLPQLGLARIDERGMLQLRQRSEHAAPRTAYQDEPAETGTRKAPVSVKVTSVQEKTVQFPADVCQAADRQGTPIAAPQLARRLGQETAVLVFPDDIINDPTTLGVAGAQTPILAVPSSLLVPQHAPTPASAVPPPTDP